MKILTEEFRAKVEQIKRERKILKLQMAVTMGYQSAQAFSNALKEPSKDFILKFCYLYGLNAGDYIKDHVVVDETTYNNEVTTLVADRKIIYENANLEKVQIIERQFERMEVSEDFLISLMDNARQMMTQLKADTIILRDAVGVSPKPAPKS